jgi:hypothetical protein
MKLRRCQHPDIRAFGAAQHAAGGKLLPIIKAACPVAGAGPGRRSCYVCVEQDPDTGQHGWEYICLVPGGGCQHRGDPSDMVRFREMVPEDVTNVKRLVECSVVAAEAFTACDDADMNYRRCSLENIEPAGKVVGGQKRHFRVEKVEAEDGKEYSVEVELVKDAEGKVEEVGAVQGYLAEVGGEP